MVPLVKPTDKTRSEEEPSKSKVSSLWSPFLYMLIKNCHTLAILAPINFLNASLNLFSINFNHPMQPEIQNLTHCACQKSF